MPETDDLDHIFAELTRDVTIVSTPRGAAAAIRSARRRRVALVGVATVALLIAGGLTFNVLADEGRLAGPTGQVAVDEQLPQPVPFDAAALNTAAAGWTSGWTDGDVAITTDPPCASQAVIPNPTAVSGDEPNTLNSGARLGAAKVFVRFASEADAHTALVELTRVEKGCASTGGGELSMPEGSAGSVRFFAGSATWLVQSGDRMALLIVNGTFPMPDPAVEASVARAVLAGLLDYDRWAPLTGDSASDSASAADPQQ